MGIKVLQDNYFMWHFLYYLASFLVLIFTFVCVKKVDTKRSTKEQRSDCKHHSEYDENFFMTKVMEFSRLKKFVDNMQNKDNRNKPEQ